MTGAIRMIIALAVGFAPSYAQLLITELNRDPAGGALATPGGASHEFVEIVNLSLDTLLLDSLFITDGVEADALLPWPSPLSCHSSCITGQPFLPPGAIALILDRDYGGAVASFPESAYPIVSGTVLLTVSDAEIGNGLAGDDGVMLYRGTKTLVREILAIAADTLLEEIDPQNGKIVFNEPGKAPKGSSVILSSFLFGKKSWRICEERVSPGSWEAINGGWIAEWRFAPPTAEVVSCTVRCLKSGRVPLDPRWRIERQPTGIPMEGIFSTEGNRCEATIPLPLDSAAYTFHIDESYSSRSWQLDLSQVWTPSSPIKISELFPQATAAEPEWFELVNTSSMPVNLRNWTFGDHEKREEISSENLILAPKSFLVVTANRPLFSARYPAPNRIHQPRRWHSLKNYDDTLILMDNYGLPKETAAYRRDWFTNFRYASLERVTFLSPGTDRSAWVVAQNPSPGQPNGSARWRSTERVSLECGPVPFTPDGDGRNDRLTITINLPSEHEGTVAIYGFSGRKLRELGQATASLSWDGRQDDGRPAPNGPFFVVMNLTAADGTKIVRRKGVLWRR